jgi:catechol 2,3-dioxygenase-like lactoylglutathione lyase family enzyme
MNLLRCDHIHLIAADVEETVQWYRRVLGARITFQGTFRGSPVYYLDIAGMTFVVFGRLENDAAPLPGTLAPKSGVDHFGFSVGDLDQVVGELRNHNVNILEGPLTVRPGLRIAYIVGPDQIRIELCERRT